MKMTNQKSCHYNYSVQLFAIINCLLWNLFPYSKCVGGVIAAVIFPLMVYFASTDSWLNHIASILEQVNSVPTHFAPPAVISALIASSQ